ncbi:MAG: transcription-repair coupling factor [Clostridiales Family XIII bacterium]|jgi:transcription-repair coupling factor (superfamily II helicase)|nr:transcription-repair coupling factor [Clostridiales Family XIII bacterium]
MASDRESICVSGAADVQLAPAAARILLERNRQCLIVTSSAARASALARALSFFIPWRVRLIGEEEAFFAQYEAKSHDRMQDRLAALADLRRGTLCVVVAPVSGAVKRLPPPELFDRHRLALKTGERVDTDALKRDLSAMGFERAALVELKGQYSLRGGILDVFPVSEAAPYRVDLFDDEIASIKRFDKETQRSEASLDALEIWPATQMIVDEALFRAAARRIDAVYDAHIRRFDGARAAALSDRKSKLIDCVKSGTNLQLLEHCIGYFYDNISYIWDYMKDGLVMLDDPDRLREALSLRDREAEEDFRAMLAQGRVAPEEHAGTEGLAAYARLLSHSPLWFFTPFSTQPVGLGEPTARRDIDVRRPPSAGGRMDFLESELRRYGKQGYTVTIVCASEERFASLREFLNATGLRGVNLQRGDPGCGAEFPKEKIVYLWEGDIFSTPKAGRSARTARGRGENASPIQALGDIEKGDCVVHENHGIGRFVCIEQLDIQGARKDYLKLEYAGGDVLYIPAEQMSLVQKYIGGGEEAPRISRLSSGEWKKAKAKAKKDIASMAQELLALSAERKAVTGHAFAADTVWQREFEDSFPYEETQDQLRSTASIKRDMEKPVPMDRLLCGDVGYGKTEVAARAVFKCVADGMQAAVLVPTTILANQHYMTFKQRFADFPFTVEMLSRFRSEARQREIAASLRAGEVDIVIGTHRLLSQDIGFRALGLLVVDEEQRFGVRHKERIKALKKGVDVLTLSATPIPRTLHMSLVGVRDMDLIEEPPEDRYPVQTYVMEQTDEVIRETVLRELDRGGQVYIVYNRVKGIQRVAAEIKALAPAARIVVGHGQMDERELEDVMSDFIERRYNVLVSTAIIESGIDIPNVNTILVMDADRFGLSQLYQLRGRVGRSNRMAYAYLLYRRDKVLSEAAEKRLRAIREFTEFGAGFRIAMRDLEIRGAGNLLGAEQHGHIVGVGYELYRKLVDEAVRALSGEVVNPDAEDVSFEINIAAHIPQSYIEDEVLKLQMYKRISCIEGETDENDVLDEMTDRFGAPPRATLNLLSIARIRALARRAGILRIRESQKRYIFEMKNGADLGEGGAMRLVARYGGRLQFHGGARPFIALRMKEKRNLLVMGEKRQETEKPAVEKLKEIRSFLRFLTKGSADIPY